MKVQAKHNGYYDLIRRYEGDVFEIQDPKEFSDKWMVKVEKEDNVKKAKPAKAKKSFFSNEEEAEVASDDVI